MFTPIPVQDNGICKKKGVGMQKKEEKQLKPIARADMTMHSKIDSRSLPGSITYNVLREEDARSHKMHGVYFTVYIL